MPASCDMYMLNSSCRSRQEVNKCKYKQEELSMICWNHGSLEILFRRQLTNKDLSVQRIIRTLVDWMIDWSFDQSSSLKTWPIFHDEVWKIACLEEWSQDWFCLNDYLIIGTLFRRLHAVRRHVPIWSAKVPDATTSPMADALDHTLLVCAYR